MKTKNRKRIGLVPITLVAVFALAAFLAAGFLTPSDAQARADGECGFNIANGGGPSGIGGITADNDKTGSEDTDDANCMVTGNSVTVKIENMDTETEANIVILISGGRDFRALQAEDGSGEVGKVGVDEISRRIDEQEEVGRKDVPGEATFTVSKSMADRKGEVLIAAWNGSNNTLDVLDDSPPTWPSNGVFQTITFLGTPAIGVDDDCDANEAVDDVPDTGEDITAADCTAAENDGEDADESRSKLEALVGTEIDVSPTFVASVLNGKSKELTVPAATDSVANEEVQIRATVKDAGGNLLDDQEVIMTLSGKPEGVVPARPVDEDTEDGIADFEVDVPGTGAFRITAKFTVGALELGSIVIARAGNLHMVSAEACEALPEDKKDEDTMDGCPKDYKAKMIYGPEMGFSIYATAKDSEGTTKDTESFMVKPATVATWWDALGCMEMNDAVMPMDDEPAVVSGTSSPYCEMYEDLSAEAEPVVDRAFGKAYGDATKAFEVGADDAASRPTLTAEGEVVPATGDMKGIVMLTVDAEALGGKYLLDVVAEAEDVDDDDKTITKSDQVVILVSDKVHEYRVTPEEAFVMPRRSAEFTVKALDKNGNPPIFEDDDSNVKVIADYGTVRGAKVTNGEDLELSKTTGEGKFTFVMPRDAVDGETFSILIGEGEMQIEAMVTVGEAPTEMMAPGMPMNVMAMADGHDMIKVTWEAPESDGNSAITGYKVQSKYGDMDWMDVDPAHMGMEMMYMDTGLMAETPYYYRVAAVNAEGMGEYSDGMSMAMTAAADMVPIAMYVITAPPRIEAGMTGSIMITAQDADGALGAITADNAAINVSLSGNVEMVTVLDLSNNQLELGTDDSMGSFRIFAKADATSGSVTITVIGEPGVATVSEMVRIGPNQNPMAGDDIADQMVLVGGTATVDSTLSDHEGDDLTYTVSSSDDMIATATNDGAMITITGVAAGDATITVTGMDTEMGSGMQTIMVTVEEPNTAPMAGDAIDDVTMTVGDDPMMVEAMFTDAENDMLSYSVMSSDDMVATATVDDMGMVTITAMGAGMATITVTASDPGELYAMQEIMVTVMMMPPMELGDPVVTGTMSDATGMATIMLTPGANAGQHWIWAQPTDRSEGMFSEKVAGDATSANMTGLTSGMSYWFTAVAGRDMEDGPTEWSEYSGWSAETPIQ